MELPQLPAPTSQFLEQVRKCTTHQEIENVIKPYKTYESKLREIFAQEPNNPVITQSHLVPIFNDDGQQVSVKARNLSDESDEIKAQYLLALDEKKRRSDGSAAMVDNLKDFRINFNLFSESSLLDFDWSNVVAAGSSVVTALLPVDAPHNESKRALRAYYHEILAPASDVDLFIYGLNEEQALNKIKYIESKIRDNILSETTTIRTKNAITIVSEYPVRHVQIVLRLYKSITEILTGFDVDCSCVAYDGNQVWASPRALAAFVTQTNTIDLTRRSPSYENRLSKYSHRGFEVYWPALDRSKIDPTIFERSFSRVYGLARLLVLEKLPHPNDRDTYLAKRREERGRPPLPWNARFRHQLPGNIKDAQPDDVAEWVEEDDVSNYHTFTIPYGPKYNAKKVEKLLFTKDLLLNAEWNKPKDRETNLHRHPAFFGSVDDVIHDCCGFCPKPETDADLAAAEEENKIYISGDVQFLKDDPGRQAIGSFHPITDDDWTEMAYIGNTSRLCQAIVDKDLEAVVDWFSSGELETVDVNRRDHVGRTPLQLATMCSTPEIVHFLIDRGARIVSRLYDGMTALHIAAYRGEVEMVKALLDRSAINEEAEDRKEEARKALRRQTNKDDNILTAPESEDVEMGNTDDGDMESDDFEDEEMEDSEDDVTEGSFVKVKEKEEDVTADDEKDEPDVYNIDVLAWDSPISPLHLAIIGGQVDVIDLLIEKYGADVLLPIKIFDNGNKTTPRAAILTLVLALQHPLTETRKTVSTLLKDGALPTQADMRHVSALHYAISSAKKAIVDMFWEKDSDSISKAINHVVLDGYYYSNSIPTSTPLLTAIGTRSLELVESVLEMGAEIEISQETFAKALERMADSNRFVSSSQNPDDVKRKYQQSVQQPIILAAKMGMPGLVSRFIDSGVNVNTIPKGAYERAQYQGWGEDKSLLDLVQDRLKEHREYVTPPQPEAPKVPESLGPDEQYLNYAEGTYKHWTATNDLIQAKGIQKHRMKQYQKQLKDIETSQRQDPEKLALAQSMIPELEALEHKLRQKGAKTFYELFPDAPKDNNNNRYNHYGNRQQKTSEPYETYFAFMVTGITPTETEEYLKLFEAAWSGDTQTVKSLCLASTSALQVAAKDRAGFSPFSIAVLRGHYDLAAAILEIATVQYKPAENESKYLYRLEAIDGDEDDYSDYSEDKVLDDLRVFGQLVDDKFTVDDISKLADNVKSKISPLAMLCSDSEVWRMNGSKGEQGKLAYRPGPRHYHDYYSNNVISSWSYFNAALIQESSRCSYTLIRHAIWKNDAQMLKFLISAGTDLVARRDDPDGLKVFNVKEQDFAFAIQLGRVELISQIIESTGAGVPLQKIVQKSGVQIDEKPRYYQGLTVHGQKRKDWAEAGRGDKRKSVQKEQIPLLKAAFEGNVDSVEYFLSETPLRRYLSFADAFKSDKHIQSLAQVSGGIEKALATWLGSRSQLALHMAIMSKPRRDGTQPIVQEILKLLPDTLDVRSSSGTTPLQLAFELGRIHAIKVLTAAGANQATRNNLGENILHTIIKQNNIEKYLPAYLSLLKQDLVQLLLLERCGAPDPGALTPLALAIKTWSSAKDITEILRTILKHSQGKDLEIMDGAGDYPIHNLVRIGRRKQIQFLVEYKPEQLYWENATGMTPIDVASSAYHQNLIENPPGLNSDQSWSIKDDKRDLNPSRRMFSNRYGYVLGNTQTEEGEEQEAGGDIQSSAYWTNLLLRKLSAQYPGKRKLVSLYDANEIAKRLAAEQQKKNEENRRRERLGLNATGMRQRYHYDQHGRDNDQDDETKDEVERWRNTAESFKKWDLEAWQKNVRKELGEEVDKDTDASEKEFRFGVDAVEDYAD